MLTLRRDFIDREEEIRNLQEKLHEEGGSKDSLVLVHGQTGIGKTQLFAKFLRLCNENEIRVAYADLSAQDYLGLIDDIEMGLGPDGFEELEQVYEDVVIRAQVEKGRLMVDRLEQEWQSAPDTRQAGALHINAPVNADHVAFAGRDVVYKNAKISNVYNIMVGDTEDAQRLNKKKITQAFRSCIREISRQQTIAILLDHWEEAQDPLRDWIREHLVEPATQFAMKKALIVLCRDELTEDMDNQTGIFPLALPLFSREVALNYWCSRGLSPEDFSSLGLEIYSLPRLLSLEVERQKLLKRSGK